MAASGLTELGSASAFDPVFAPRGWLDFPQPALEKSVFTVVGDERERSLVALCGIL
jgi:hypothetical protein